MSIRKKLIVGIGSLVLIVLLVFVFLDGSFLTKRYASVWSDQYIENLENEQSKMIAYGIRAASSHNTQPWLVKSKDQNTIELYADINKALLVVDADNKQLLMSQGTFIESYKQAALRFGYGVDIVYSEPDFTDKRPLMATMTVYNEGKINTVDTISSSTYDSMKSLEDLEFKEVMDEFILEHPSFKYTIVDSGSETENLKNILLEGTIIESRDKLATLELLNVFRWTEWEKNTVRYGLSLNTLPGIIKPFVQPIMNFSSKNWESFGESGINQFKDKLSRQSKYILIKCDDSNAINYIFSGQLYQKLIFVMDDYELRPAMQVLENFDAMGPLNARFQKEYGGDGEVLMIIGMMEKTGATISGNPRHLVEDIIVE